MKRLCDNLGCLYHDFLTDVCMAKDVEITNEGVCLSYVRDNLNSDPPINWRGEEPIADLGNLPNEGKE